MIGGAEEREGTATGGPGMTEEQWATTDRPNSVLYDIERNGRQLLTNRKIRLFACGCYRLIWNQITLPSIHRLVELAEARADRLIKQSELSKYRYAEGDPPRNSPDYLLQSYTKSLLGSKVVPGYIAWLTRSATNPERYQHGGQWQACPEQANLARDIFGNPFRPVAFDPDWRTSTAVALAQQMYDTRDFAAMPILADALQDAGCESPDILDHCRNPNGVHVRGCWVVDLLTGRS